MAASTPRPQAQELQARTTAEVDKGSSSGGQTSGWARRQASWFWPLHLLLLFGCLSPVTFSIPKVEAGTSPVDPHIQVPTAILERAQRLEQSGVPAFQQIQRHLDPSISQHNTTVAQTSPETTTPQTLPKHNTTVAQTSLGKTSSRTLPKVTRAEAQKQVWEGVWEDDVLKIEEAVLSGADLEEVRGRDKMTPLTVAAKEGRVGAVRTLLRLGARVEGRGGEWQGTALHWSSWRGHKAVVRELLAAGASIGAEDKDKLTPLHAASQEGHEAVVRELLAAGASVGAEARDRWTPLHLASQEGHVAVVRDLLAAGASVGAEDKDKFTPLHAASQEGHEAVVRELLAAGASVGAGDKFRWTPLHYGTAKGHLAIARLLVGAGADLKARTRLGETPLAVAVRRGLPNVAAYLRSVGATA